MNNRLFKIIINVCLMLFIAIITTSCGSSGGTRAGVSVHHDIHYRNPWYGHRYIPPPDYIGPPPEIVVPDLPVEAVPLPMDL